ncbi:transmembrane protein, putative (macronuclear) [Tetrahymena thermophila SB210]|uniref:Transmembrane protein, putative n=1 Tax=Tetrahymena thermophila (strain SB210) TaxID=312017 RepID=W7XFF4_TETTS|nr:transmembrane protein, putative [Tetrahymena thermophila SB210]EWS76557.1 transmembrane protein, putative [Tetrahymena thermophila SB210]|eukprot:XP_012650929.1 transmembrane protein, putative [Tetrahymena thermophila SB210]
MNILLTFQIINNNFYYIEKRNLLIIQNIPQIFDLSLGKQLIQNIQDYQFSLDNFIIINDDYLAYVALNNQLENNMYLIDLQFIKVEQVFNFGQQTIVNFWITNNQYQPLIALNDLIYISITSNQQYQPFSLSKKQFIYKLETLQITPLMCKSIIYQKTGEIFIFYYSSIYIYSYNLQFQMVINTGIQYPFLNTSFLDLVYSEQYVFYFNQNQFYKFDMQLKKIFYINANSDLYKYRKQQVNFYIFESSSFIKKSQNIIDTDNMIVIKSQQEDNIYLGNQKIDDDTQFDIFESQNGIYWHINLFNHPFSTLNLTETQSIQDMIIEQNKIVIYDSNSNNLIIYDATKLIQEFVQIQLDFKFDLMITMLDWDEHSFIWINNSTIYVFNYKQTSKIQMISSLDSEIIEYQVCKDQNIVIVKTVNLILYSVSINNRISKQINISFLQSYSDLKFYLQCDQKLVIVYYPQVKIFDFVSGEDKSSFNPVMIINQFYIFRKIPTFNYFKLIIIFSNIFKIKYSKIK